MTLRLPAESLSREAILEGLEASFRARISLEIHEELPSTNQHLLDAAVPALGHLSVCLAESQSAGRGRRGKVWYSPPYAGLYLSAGWKFHQIPPDLSALALAVGVIARRVMQSETGLSVKLKWPNDLMWAGRKLGGILVEVKEMPQSSCYVVVGVGLNVTLSELRSGESTQWPAGAVDLCEAMAGNTPSRVTLAAAFIEGLVKLAENYGETGFLPYHAEFVAADFLRGHMVELDDLSGSVLGRAVSVEPDGFLLLETPAGTHRVSAGDVSVRSLP